MKTKFSNSVSLRQKGVLLGFSILLAGFILASFSFPSEFKDECLTSNCTLLLSYDATEITTYKLQNGVFDDLTALEKVKLKSRQKELHVEVCLNKAGDIITEILLLNPEEYFEDWMSQIAKTVITEKSVKVYDDMGVLLLDRSKSAKSLDVSKGIYQGLFDGLKPAPQFLKLTTEHYNQLQQAGFTVETLPNGAIKANNGSLELIYDTENRLLTKSFFKDGILQSSITEHFIEDSSKELVPNYKLEKSYKTFPSGVCVEENRLTVYKNYFANRAKNRSFENEFEASNNTLENNNSMSVYPNPGNGLINIRIPKSLKGKMIKIRVLNAIGQIISEFEKKANRQFQLDLSNFNSGIYSISLEGNGERYSKKIIKP